VAQQETIIQVMSVNSGRSRCMTNRRPTEPGSTDTIHVGSRPYSVAITPNGEYAYVVNKALATGKGAVQVINTATNTATTPLSFPVGQAPTAVAITPDGRRAYVTNQGANTVSEINTDYTSPAASYDTVLSTFAVGYFPEGAATDGTRAYVANHGSNDLSLISVAG